MAEKLRFGIMCNGTEFQQWQAECVRSLVDSGLAELVLLIQPEKGTLVQRSFFQKLKQYPLNIGLYMFYRRHFFNPPSMKMEDLSKELAGVPSIECAIEKRKFSEYFQAADVDRITAADLHFILRFGFNIIRGDILNSAQYGVWSFHHGDEEKYRGGPPGLWEIHNGDPVSGAILQRLTDRLDGGIVLKKGYYKTIDHSLQDNVDQLLNRSAQWPTLICKDILNREAQYLNASPSKTVAPIYKYPGNGSMLGMLMKLNRNKARFHRAELKEHEEWNVAIMYQPISNFLEEKASLNMRWLPDPILGNFRADPFGYMLDGNLNILYEKYKYSNGKGTISRLRPRKDAILKRSRSVLEGEEHFSYPYTFEHDGEIWVLPECFESDKLDLYKVNKENNELEFVKTLIEDLPAIDPSLVEVDGQWWLFYTLPEASNSELHIRYADEMMGPYKPHAANPVKCDIRSSRPAGTPFFHNGDLYRPAQDGSETYGGRIAMNKVLRLTPTAFDESVEKFIGPMKGTKYDQGMHTVSSVGDITLIDGKRYVTVKDQHKRQMRRKMDRLMSRNKK